MSWKRKQDRRSSAGTGGRLGGMASTARQSLRRMWSHTDRQRFSRLMIWERYDDIPARWSSRHWGIWEWF